MIRANAGPVKALVTEAGGVLIKADAEEDDSELFLNLNIGGGGPFRTQPAAVASLPPTTAAPRSVSSAPIIASR